jgi:hypothetical protein
MRGGGFTSIVRKFSPNMYVYVCRLQEIKGDLTPLTRPAILRVKQVIGNEQLLLQGKCTSLLKAHVGNAPRVTCQTLTPAWIRSFIVRIDTALGRSAKLTHAFAEMLLCDRCNSGWHTFCLDPPVSRQFQVLFARIARLVVFHLFLRLLCPLWHQCYPQLKKVLFQNIPHSLFCPLTQKEVEHQGIWDLD